MVFKRSLFAIWLGVTCATTVLAAADDVLVLAERRCDAWPVHRGSYVSVSHDPRSHQGVSEDLVPSIVQALEDRGIGVTDLESAPHHLTFAFGTERFRLDSGDGEETGKGDAQERFLHFFVVELKGRLPGSDEVVTLWHGEARLADTRTRDVQHPMEQVKLLATAAMRSFGGDHPWEPYEPNPKDLAGSDFEAGLARYRRGDFDGALRTWRGLAEDGCLLAGERIGEMYFFGHGVAQDYFEAARWLRPVARYRPVELAYLYANGHGLRRDPAEAFYWCSVASREDNDHPRHDAPDGAAGKLDLIVDCRQLASDLTSEQRANVSARAERALAAFRLPKLVKKVEPVYPGRLAKFYASARVDMSALIDVDGSVEHVHVLEVRPGEGTRWRTKRIRKAFAGAAVHAVRQWRYEPATADGKPIPLMFKVRVDFNVR